jgi:hypothetical protein
MSVNEGVKEITTLNRTVTIAKYIEQFYDENFTNALRHHKEIKESGYVRENPKLFF